MEILVVDDDTTTRALLRARLLQWGWKVTVAQHGAQALEVLRTRPFRVILADWEMPGVSGVDLCRAVRARESHTYTYIVLLTGHRDPDHVRVGLESGADDYIIKPFNDDELRLRLNAGRRIARAESWDAMVFALAKLAGARDWPGSNHLERVRRYCMTLAEELATHPRYINEVTAEFRLILMQVCPLYDIGKVTVPDRVLFKPGQLTPEEFAIMTKHTVRGARVLDTTIKRFPAASFLSMARDLVLSHHEKFDGTGYPEGRAGRDRKTGIPLAARIVALADAYDVIRSKRVYKDEVDHARACQIINTESGKHFDPDIVEAFNDAQDVFAEIYNELADVGGEAIHG
ncbi:MAG: response regulator [Phycisphaera sp.]|nr:response regulator [Phycisphaera sp.]